AGEATLELPELVVDEHAQRLERAGGGMLAGLARAHGGPDEGGELAGAGERMSAPRRDDGLRHAPRETLLSEGGDHLAHLVKARTSEPRRNGFAARRVHAHVERAVSAEAEPALRIIELRRGHAEVEEHTAASTASASAASTGVCSSTIEAERPRPLECACHGLRQPVETLTATVTRARKADRPGRPRCSATGRAARSSAPHPTARTDCPDRSAFHGARASRTRAARVAAGASRARREADPSHSRPSAAAAGARSRSASAGSSACVRSLPIRAADR